MLSGCLNCDIGISFPVGERPGRISESDSAGEGRDCQLSGAIGVEVDDCTINIGRANCGENNICIISKR